MYDLRKVTEKADEDDTPALTAIYYCLNGFAEISEL